MKLREHFLIAIDAMRANLTRSLITSAIIALGITALVGILTSVDGIKNSINEKFTEIGANSFSIVDHDGDVRFGSGNRKKRQILPIRYREAERFKKEFTLAATVSVYANASWGSTVKHGSNKTDPNVRVAGIDENYLDVSGYTVDKGRNFSPTDLKLNNNYALIGQDVASRVFPDQDPIGENILVGAAAYTVIGVLKEKGSSVGSGSDRMVCIPVTVAKEKYLNSSTSFEILCGVSHPSLLEPAIGEARSLMRRIRSVPLTEEDDFDVIMSDQMAKDLLELLGYLTISATIIGLITLVGAAIGLLNIMLVSVTERTREIGTRKALGATPSVIRMQFLIEAVTICLTGGLFGVLFGILAGNLVSSQIGGGFIIPWLWMSMGIFLCVLVGTLAGFYPASKAARLDPIESLRFE